MKTICFMILASLALAERARPDNAMAEIRDAHFIISATTVPALSVWADKDTDEINDGIEFDADLHSGQGAALKLAVGDAQTDLGLMFLTTRHRERITGSIVHLEGLFVEGAHRYFWGIHWFGELAGGLGGVVFDLPDRFRSGDGAAFLIRGALGVEYWDHARLQLGVGYFRWGHPGETYGDGTYVDLGGAWLF